jgi:hypothetical protein
MFEYLAGDFVANCLKLWLGRWRIDTKEPLDTREVALVLALLVFCILNLLFPAPPPDPRWLK